MSIRVAAMMAFFIGLSSTNALAQTFEVRASTHDFNRLVFPVPYDSIVVPPEAQLSGNIIPLAGHRSVLIRPRSGAAPIPVFVQLQNGESFTVKLMPGTATNGSVFRYKDAQDMSEAPEQVTRPNDKWLANAFVQAYQGSVPDGFALSEMPDPVRLIIKGEKEASIRLAPIARYRGSQHRISIYQLQADALLNIEPRDFYHANLIAASLEGDVVGPKHHPRLVVLEVDDAGK